MKKIYYKIWIDAIKGAIKADKHNANPWQFTLLIIFSVAQGINLLTIFFWVGIFFGEKIDIFISINLFPVKNINSFFSAFITLFLPFLLLNYFLLFYKKRYEKLLDKYNGFKMKEGVVFMLYFIASMLIFLLPVMLG